MLPLRKREEQPQNVEAPPEPEDAGCQVEIDSEEDQTFSDLYATSRVVARCPGCGLESEPRTSEGRARADLAAKCAAAREDS